mgnify:CR=1 FL=1
MINPAQYQQVLQKMPDQALMQLLKRPDKIPSQFVVQEINRRKQMRQAGQAQKQQVANAVAMQQQPPQQPMGMRDGGASDENVGSAQNVLAMELRFAEGFSKPVQGEEGTNIYKGMSDVFFNEKGVPKKVSGAMEMSKAINEGFVFTRDDADKFPAPPISREEKIFKRSNNILEAYGRGGGALLQDADEKAENYIKELEALNKLSPNYNRFVSSASGMTRTLVPRSETADGLLDRLAGGYDIKVEYDPSKNENLPKPKPKMAEGGITAMGMKFGGRSGYRSYPMQSGIDFGIEYPDSLTTSFLNRADTPYYVSRQARKKGMGFIPLYERSEQDRQVPTRRGGVRTILPYQRGTGPYQFGDPNIASQGRPFGVTPEVTTPDGKTFTPVETSSEDPDNLGNFPEVVLDGSGIKSVDSTNDNKPINENAIKEGKKSNSQLDKLVASLGSQINDQVAKTKEPFNAQSVLEGYKNSEFFDQTSAAYQNLNTKSKSRIDSANKAGVDLIKERQKYAAQLEKEGRTPENIVFTSLIQMGLSLMASPNANFTQALGQAGQSGFATFQNLRKEQKDLVKEKYKRAYEIAEAEYKHKMNISQLENELDVQKVNAATTINNLARTEKKDYIDQQKVEFEMDNLKKSYNLEKDKLKLDKTTKGIAALLSLKKEDRADTELDLKSQLTKAQIEDLNEDKSDFAQLVKIGTGAGLKKEDIVNSYLESKFGKEDTYSEDLKAIAGLAKELAKDYTFDDDEDVNSFMTILNKVTRDVMGLTQEVSSGASYDNVSKDTAKLGQN